MRNRRRSISSDEVAKCIKDAVTLDNTNYRQMVTNTFAQNISWEGNAAYNGGQSANTRYMREVFHLNEKTLTPLSGKERYMKPLRRLVGAISGVMSYIANRTAPIIQAINESKPAESLKETAEVAKATKWGKIITGGAVGVIAIGTGSMIYLNNKKAKDIEKQLLKDKPSFSKVG